LGHSGQGPIRLTAENLAAERGGETVVEGIGFSIGSGEALIVTGPNGSGKSTLLRVIAGLLPASSGSVRLSGAPTDIGAIAGNCHYLGHLNGLKPALSVAENLSFWRDFSGTPRLGIGEALAEVGLGAVADLPLGFLSTGQRRRVAIARLLLNERPLWLLDEPTAGLDEASREGFAALMRRHLAESGLIVAATHEALRLPAGAELRLGGRG
jgi:heme exporter protein A